MLHHNFETTFLKKEDILFENIIDSQEVAKKRAEKLPALPLRAPPRQRQHRRQLWCKSNTKKWTSAQSKGLIQGPPVTRALVCASVCTWGSVQVCHVHKRASPPPSQDAQLNNHGKLFLATLV